jgi:hypothetical protein
MLYTEWLAGDRVIVPLGNDRWFMLQIELHTDDRGYRSFAHSLTLVPQTE